VFFCYILQCADGTYYTGWTTDPVRYTSMRRPVRLVYLEPQPDRSSAMRRERQIKTLPRKKKTAMIAAYHPEGTE
jgi:putative endonuclease